MTRPWIADTIWAAVLAVLSVYFAFPNVTACLLALPLCASLSIRRTFPVAALALGTVSAAVQAWLLPLVSVSVLAVPVMVYSLRRWSGRTLGLIGLAIALVGAATAPMIWLRDQNTQAIFTTACAYSLAILAVYGFGLRVSEREEAALAYARAQAAEERTEIAREVHDIVAHSLSLIAVQAEGGRSLVRRNPGSAPEILDVIADESRKALNEIRDMVTLLRRGSLPDEEHGSAAIRELVARIGDRARITVTGDIAPALGFTIYRVIQEALTNFLRHAGPQATVDVTVEVDDAAAEITVRDDGIGQAAPTDGKGHGLTTMRERIDAHGGTLTAAPLPHGGYQVHAVIPTRAPSEMLSGVAGLPV